PCKPINCSPIQADKPDSTNPSAIAKPPPNSNKIPQGNLRAVFQSSKRSPGLFFDGMINKTSAAKIAIIVSSIFGLSFSSINEREIQASAAKTNTVNTIFSSLDALPNCDFSFAITSFPPGNFLNSDG